MGQPRRGLRRVVWPSWLVPAELALVGTTVAWGMAFVAAKWALQDAGPVGLTALRMWLGFVAVVVLGRVSLRRVTGLEWRAGLAAGTVLAGGYLLQTAGLRTATAAASGFLTALYVVLTPIFEAVVFRRAPPARDIGTLLLAAAGIVLMAGGAELHLAAGELLVAASAICWAGQIVLVGRFAARTGARRLTVVQILTVAVVTSIVLPFSGEAAPEWSPRFWGAALYLGVITGAGGLLVQAWAQRIVPPTRAATLYTGEPLFALLFGVALLGESLDPPEIVGALVVMTAVVLTVRSRSRPAGHA